MAIYAKSKAVQEKKSETLEVRLAYSKKTAFMDACSNAGITASHTIRDFIDVYISGNRTFSRQRVWWLLAATGLVSALLVGAAFFAHAEMKQAETRGHVFSMLDTNGDRLLTAADATPQLAQMITLVLQKADENQDGQVTANEFAREIAASRVYTVEADFPIDAKISSVAIKNSDKAT